MRRRSDWGQAVMALLLIMACSFIGTLAAGILLLIFFGG